MNAKTTIRFVILALTALTLAAIPAIAQGPGPGGPGGPFGPGAGMHRLMRALDLSDAQRDQVHGVAERYRDEVFEPSRETLLEARHALAQAIHNTSATEADVREAALALAGLEADMAVQRHAMWVEIDAFLTGEQRSKAQEILAEGPPAHPKRRGHCPDGPGRGRHR